jgi:hypothetical protein
MSGGSKKREGAADEVTVGHVLAALDHITGFVENVRWALEGLAEDQVLKRVSVGATGLPQKTGKTDDTDRAGHEPPAGCPTPILPHRPHPPTPPDHHPHGGPPGPHHHDDDTDDEGGEDGL